MNIPFFYTYVHSSAEKTVCSVLKSTFLSEGKVVRDFENSLSEKLDLKFPVAVNSGTSALHLALLASGIGEGDEVICPAQTFVASGLAILYATAKPIFADIQYQTGNICPDSVEAKITEKTKAIMVVHWGGYPCDLDEIRAIARKHNLIVIEDAAHALGASYKNSIVGSISDFTCFSFQAIKHLTTGDGGAVCCQSQQSADSVIQKRWFGIDRANSTTSVLGERQYDISEPGYKYHLNNYAAALGLANLEGFTERLVKRQEIAKLYSSELAKIKGISLFGYKNDRTSAYWLYGFHVEERENFITALKNRGVPASVVHQRIDRNSVFGGLRPDLPNQTKFDETQIHIPIHDGLSDEQVEHIIAAVKKGW